MVSSRLYVGNLAWFTTKEDLRSAFEKYGKVVNVTVVLDKHTLKSCGFGFVEFSRPEDSERAQYEMNGVKLHDLTLRVERASS